jgi:secreted PhoX family phosphatase
LPVYQQHRSYLATGLGTGTLLPAKNDTKLKTYTVIDDLVVPPEYERYVIVHWGDRVFQNPDDYVGYNADYTGFVPVTTTRTTMSAAASRAIYGSTTST